MKRCPAIKFVSHGPLGCRPERCWLNNKLKVQTKMFDVALDDCKLLVLLLRCGGESDDCKVPWGMSSRASPWPRQRRRTTERHSAAHHESTRLPPGCRHQATRTDGEEVRVGEVSLERSMEGLAEKLIKVFFFSPDH